MAVFRSGLQVFFHLLKGTDGFSLDEGLFLDKCLNSSAEGWTLYVICPFPWKCAALGRKENTVIIGSLLVSSLTGGKTFRISWSEQHTCLMNVPHALSGKELESGLGYWCGICSMSLHHHLGFCFVFSIYKIRNLYELTWVPFTALFITLQWCRIILGVWGEGGEKTDFF